MKRFISLFIALTMLLSLAACGTKAEPPKEETSPEQPDTEYSFVVSTDVYEDECTAKDGTVLLRVRYELPHLDIVPDMAGDGVTDARMLAVQNTFNAEMEQQRSAQVELFSELCDVAKEGYANALEYGLDWNGYADEVTLKSTFQTAGGLLNVCASAYSYMGGPHPNNGFSTWNYDLNEGRFLQYTDFTDDGEAFRAAAADEILAQIDAQGLGGSYFSGYEESVRELSYAEVYFGEDGMTVCFPEYVLAPHAMGLPAFTVPYGYLLADMNDYGRELLADYITEQDTVLADYFEARELWYYFDLCTMPTDSEQSAERNGHTYYRVNCRGLSSMAELRTLLLTRFDEAIVDELLAPNDDTPIYCDIDGALYGLDAGGRGSDIMRGDATYAVELTADGNGGKVIATVEEYDANSPGFEQAYGEMIVAGYSTIEYPFVLTENGAQFTHFESIW